MPQSVQYQQRGADLQRAVPSAAYELKDLGDKLNFTNATRAKFDVFDAVLASHFLADLSMQGTHGVNGAEVEVFAVDKGARHAGRHRRSQAASVSFITPRLDPGIAPHSRPCVMK